MSRRRYTRWQFEQAYARHCRTVGKAISIRRLESLWVCHRGLQRRARACKGAFNTTNKEGEARMKNAGREREERTIRRLHRELEAMGLAQATHIKRSGAARRPGELDYLRIAVANISFVRPCFAGPRQEETSLQDVSSIAEAPTSTATTTASLPPPTAADGDPPHEGAGTPLASKEGIEAQIRFQELKLTTGFGCPDRIRATIGHLRAELRELEASAPATGPAASSPEPPKDSDDRRSAQ
jgi:hypothetical protein